MARAMCRRAKTSRPIYAREEHLDKRIEIRKPQNKHAGEISPKLIFRVKIRRSRTYVAMAKTLFTRSPVRRLCTQSTRRHSVEHSLVYCRVFSAETPLSMTSFLEALLSSIQLTICNTLNLDARILVFQERHAVSGSSVSRVGRCR